MLIRGKFALFLRGIKLYTMINSKELRIGNLIYRDDNMEEFTVGGIDGAEVSGTTRISRGALVGRIEGQSTHSDGTEICFHCGISLEEAEGIPLTPDILEKCGFERVSGKEGWEWKKGYFTIGEVSYYFIEGAGFSRKIDTLHQLQNLYFVLIGEELKYQP